MSMPILFCAPDGVCAAQLVRTLATDLEVHHFTEVSAAAHCCEKSLPLAVVLPLAWPGCRSGDPRVESPTLEFLRHFAERTTVFVYGCAVSEEALRRALAAGASAVLTSEMPDFAGELRRRLVEVVRMHRMRLEEEQALAVLFATHSIVGTSPAMLEVFRRGMMVSHLRDLPVLITGAQGTPRGRLAAAIHHLDPHRSRKPLFALDGTGLTRVLADCARRNQNEPGSPADRGWEGLREALDQGTLFLDRIEELDAETQQRLVRWSRTRRNRSDAGPRLIAGLEGSLEEAIELGRLHPELSDWVGLFRVAIPSLRHHPEDIAAQARRALRAYQAGRERVVLDFEPEVLARLCRLPWDGNTRQLERVVRDTLAQKDRGAIIRWTDLPMRIREAAVDLTDVPLSLAIPTAPPALGRLLQDYERRLLRSLGRLPKEASTRDEIPGGLRVRGEG